MPDMKSIALRVVIVPLLSLFFAAPAQSVVFTVGSDAACTHSSILLAVAAAGANGPAPDEVRIAQNHTNTGVIVPIVSQNVTIRGGFATCAATTTSGLTIVQGSTAGTNGIFTTSGVAAEPYGVLLRSLTLRDGGNLAGRRGGALRIEGSFSVIVESSLIINNRAGRGGGIYLDGTDGASLSLTSGTEISGNTAGVSGGGIYCTHDGFISMGRTFVTENAAQDGGSDPGESGNGGGVALFDGCRMLQTASTAPPIGIHFNTAARHGGGYYLRGADLFVRGTALASANVTANVAGDTGGGIGVFDDISGGIPSTVRSDVVLENSWIEGNRAPRGGGIGLVVGGTVDMRRTLRGDACHTTANCSSLSFNGAPGPTDACIGAAVHAGLISTVDIRNTFVEENCQSATGSPVYVEDNATVLFESSIVAYNGGAEPFYLDDSFDGTLRIGWSTVTGNYDTPHVALFNLPSAPLAHGDLLVYGSILGEPFQQMTQVRGGATTPIVSSFDCVMVSMSYVGSVTPFRGIKQSPPYGLSAPSMGVYAHASGTASPGVDYCDPSFDGRDTGDAEGHTAIADAPRANVHGIFDLGAYEFGASTLPDALFANGFE
jgi:predicted outer membrane repeat protein